MLRWIVLVAGLGSTAIGCVPPAGDADPEALGGSSDGEVAVDCLQAPASTHCEGDRVVVCNEDGQRQTIQCDSECQVGSNGAGCVIGLGESCHAPVHDEVCAEPGGIVECRYGRRHFAGCADSEVCRTSGRLTRCIDAALPTCDPDWFTPRCEDDGLVTCGSFGVEQTDPCPRTWVCREYTIEPGASCFDPQDEPCDPEVFEARCEDEAVLSCDPWTGYTRRAWCGDDRCYVSDAGVGCIPVDARFCDPASFAPRCVAGSAEWCDALGVVRTEHCAVGDACVAGESPSPAHWSSLAECLPPDTPTCPGGAEGPSLRCHGDVVLWCLGSKVVREAPCGGCAIDPEGAVACSE